MRRNIAVSLALVLIVGSAAACQSAPPPPPGPERSDGTHGDAPPPDLEFEVLDLQTALREMEMELKRLELEWDPTARPGVIAQHREHLEAFRYRMRAIREHNAEILPHAAGDFAKMTERVERDFEQFDRRADVLESALAHAAAPSDEYEDLPRVY